jgi:hypothetical protein
VEVVEGFELVRAGQRSSVDGAESAVLDELADSALGFLSSEARNTSGGWPATSPATGVPAKVVLNAFTTRAPGAFWAISAAAEPALTVTGANEEKSMGLVMSTTTLPESWSP